MISERDRDIVRAEVAEKIEELMPLTRLGLDWRPGFESQVSYWRARANGAPVMSDAHREYMGWSLAHQFVLDEN